MDMTQPATATPRTAWRWFPWFLVAALGLVVGVNVLMAVLAHRSAPGVAVQGSFATSNAYGHIQQEARRQVALGWSLNVGLRDNRITVQLSGPGGAPLPHAQLQAIATRPVADAPPVALAMLPDGAGGFVAAAALPGEGQWDVLFTAVSEGHSFRHTRRIIVP